MTESALPDYSIYWVKFRFPNGRLSSGATFNQESFEEHYGQEAARAVNNYMHFSANPPADEKAWHMFRESVQTLQEALGEDPVVLSSSNNKYLIENI